MNVANMLRDKSILQREYIGQIHGKRGVLPSCRCWSPCVPEIAVFVDDYSLLERVLQVSETRF